jgi:CRISPR system Cascade subunit CasC
MLVELHLLQNHVPSNLNRDDIGGPKTAIFGGALRARISSQCIKRSLRQSEIFQTDLADHVGQRTKSFPELVQTILQEVTPALPADEVRQLVTAMANIAKLDKGEESAETAELRTAQLIFLGATEARKFTNILLQLRKEQPASYKKLLKGEKLPPKEPLWQELKKAYDGRSVDIAMFGRMTTSDAFVDVEAAMEVAHALSTHAITQQVDYFTAMDDLGEEPGAGHLGENLFNSATYYKYFSLDYRQLLANLDPNKTDPVAVGELARRAVLTFIRTAVLTVPSGKSKGHAHNNMPDLILVCVRPNATAISYANAFVKPIQPNAGEDLMELSIRRLCQYAQHVNTAYSLKGASWLVSTYPETSCPGVTTAPNLDALLAQVQSQLPA